MGWSSKAARRAYTKKWYAKNKVRLRAYYKTRRHKTRASNLKRYYGITAEDYTVMLAAQHGGCAICSAPPKDEKPLCVDHDHETQEVRALLCSQCNLALGALKDDPMRAYAVARYLEEHGK